MQHRLSESLIRKSQIVNPKSIRNLVFDFGGVICNIDVKLTEKAFMDLAGLQDMQSFRRADTGSSISDSSGIFGQIETGAITPQHFRDELRRFFRKPVTDEQLDDAWNAMLLDIPEPRIRLLESLRNDYRIFLLSNSNEIHYMKFLERFRKQSGYADFDALFEKAYFSFLIGLRKPSPEIFSHVLNESMLEPSETLFIDDTLMHVEGAVKAGIYACHLALD